MKALMVRMLAGWQILVSVAVLALAAGVSWLIIHGADRTLTHVPVTLSECQKANAEQYDCYARYYAALTYNRGTAAAFSDMKTAYASDDFVKQQCHQLAHIVGRTAFEKTGSLEKAYAEGDNFCWSGFYHGAIEHAITKLGPDNIKRNAADVCQSFAQKQRYSFDHFNCVHGLGHGLMAVANYNLFDGLKLCDSTRTAWEQESCYGGVFMENVMVASRGDGRSAYLDPKRPLYPCTDVAVTYKQQCYLMQTSYILQHNGYDFTATFNECARADQDFVDTCYQSAGRDASGSTNSDVDRTLANCRKAPSNGSAQDPGDDRALRNCMLGADRDFVSYYHDNKRALELCAGFGGDLQPVCESDVARYYGTF